MAFYEKRVAAKQLHFETFIPHVLSLFLGVGLWELLSAAFSHCILWIPCHFSLCMIDGEDE